MRTIRYTRWSRPILAAVLLFVGAAINGATTPQTIDGSGSRSIHHRCEAVKLDPAHSILGAEIIFGSEPHSRPVEGETFCVTYAGKTFTTTYHRHNYACAAGLTCPIDMEPNPSGVQLNATTNGGWLSYASPRFYVVPNQVTISLRQVADRYVDGDLQAIFVGNEPIYSKYPDEPLGWGTSVYIG